MNAEIVPHQAAPSIIKIDREKIHTDDIRREHSSTDENVMDSKAGQQREPGNPGRILRTSIHRISEYRTGSKANDTDNPNICPIALFGRRRRTSSHASKNSNKTPTTLGGSDRGSATPILGQTRKLFGIGNPADRKDIEDQMKIEVILEYDEPTRKWEVLIKGTTSMNETRQAFNAAILTLQDPHIRVGMEHQVRKAGKYEWRLIPAVTEPYLIDSTKT
jgi:hypothetical protein